MSKCLKVCVFWGAYVAAAVICQVLFGDFPAQFFVFPVNAAAMLLWMAVLWVLYREKRGSAAVRLLLARETTLTLIGIFIAACLIQGFCASELTGSWWFIAVLFAFLSHIFLVLLRGMSHPRPFRLRFFLNHAGLFIALAGGMFGSPDTKDWRTVAGFDGPVREAVDIAGHRTALDCDFQLVDWDVESYDNGAPKSYEAEVRIDGKKDIVLKVNHPYRLSWRDDLYLSGLNEGGCVLQVVRHPWKYAEFLGVAMLLAGAFLVFLQGPAGASGSRTRKEAHEQDVAARSGTTVHKGRRTEE